jgi:hypothetical protein
MQTILRQDQVHLMFAFPNGRMVASGMDFNLCPDCLAKYRVLQFDASAPFSPCLIPFGCIIWSDEHRPVSEGALIGHDRCLHSLIRLTSARTHLWRTGQLPDASQQLWREAQELIPDWPGFKRLALTAEQLRALDSCEAEAFDSMNALRRDAAIFALEDCGGGVMRFVAHPPPPRPPGPSTQKN